MVRDLKQPTTIVQELSLQTIPFFKGKVLIFGGSIFLDKLGRKHDSIFSCFTVSDDYVSHSNPSQESWCEVYIFCLKR